MRPGRKRNLDRDRRLGDPAKETIARRVRDHIWRDVRHPFHGFPLGIMFAMQIIDEPEFEAGKRWALLSVRVRAFEGLPFDHCRAQNFEGNGGRALRLEPGADEVAEHRRAKRRLERLNVAIENSHPQAIGIMRKLCLLDLELEPREKAIAKTAMMNLAALGKTP